MIRTYLAAACSAVLQLLFLLTSACAVQAEFTQQLSVPRDLFPFNTALPQLETLHLAPEENRALTVDSGWSNTSNRERGAFFIDAETRLVEPRLVLRLSRRWQLGLRLPFFWRGGGVLDESIYQWHQFFGLPQGPRDNRGGRSDLFLIEAVNGQGEELAIRSQGFGLGDLGTHVAVDISEPSPEATDMLYFGLQLPSGREEFGLEGPALSIGLENQRRFSSFALRLAGNYSILSDVDFGDFQYKRHLYSALLNVSIPFNRAELYLGLLFHSDLLANVPAFPSYQLYLDTGLRLALTEAVSVSLLLRENPAPDTGTADVTGFLSLNYVP